MNEGLFRSPNARAAFPSGGPAPVGAQRIAARDGAGFWRAQSSDLGREV